MRRLLFILALFLALVEPAQAAHRGNSAIPASQTPTVQNMAINEGIATRVYEGTVDLDSLLLTTNSAPAASFILQQTSGSANYFDSICDIAAESSPQTIPTGSTISVQNNCALATPVIVVGNKGSGYATSDYLNLDNGSCVTITGVDTDFQLSITGIIDSFTITTPTVKTAAYAIGNTHVVGSNGVCPNPTSTSGLNANFTSNYFGKAQSPFPSNAGQLNNWGYTPTPSGCAAAHDCTIQPGAITISAVAVGLDGSHSSPATLTINLDPRGCNVGPYGKFFDNVDNCGWGNGASTTQGIQAWRNNEPNCTTGASSTCDLRLMFSSGRNQWQNPNSTVCCGLPVVAQTNNLNYGYAVLNDTGHGAGTPSITDLMTYIPACRADGTLLKASTATRPAVYNCNSGASVTSPMDQMVVFGSCSGSGCGAANTCRSGGGSSVSDGTSWIDLNGFMIGGAPKYNYVVSKIYGQWESGVCHGYVTNNVTDIPTTYSPTTGKIVSSVSNVYYVGYEISNYNDHLTLNRNQYFNVGNAWEDEGTDVTSPIGNGSLDITIQSTWGQHYFNNGLGPAMSTINMSDTYLCEDDQWPLTAVHPDNTQLNNGAVSLNSIGRRTYFMGCGGGFATTNGVYMGNAQIGAPPIGIQYIGGFWAGNANTGAFFEGMDDTGSQPGQFSDFTLWRQQPPVVTAGANPDWGGFCANPSCQAPGLSLHNPNNLDVMVIGVGCHGDSSYSTCLASEKVFTITFVTGTPTGDQVQISGTPGSTSAIDVQGTMTNWASAIGVTPTQGNCTLDGNPAHPITFGAISNDYAAYSAANGGTGAHLCTAAPVGGTIQAIYLDDDAANNNYYFPIMGYAFVPGSTTSCLYNMSWFQNQFCLSENSYGDNLPVFSNAPPGQANYHGPSLTLNNFASASVACSATFTGVMSGTTVNVSGVTGTVAVGQSVSGSSVAGGTTITGGSGTTWTITPSQSASGTMSSDAYYCGSTTPFVMDKDAIFDNVNGNSSNWWTISQTQTGLGSTYFNFTSNNRVFANDSGCAYQGGPGNGGLCQYFGMFANDNSGTSTGAEQILEAKTNAFWLETSPGVGFNNVPAELTAFYAATLTPKSAGSLDLGSGSWVGGLNGSGASNEGNNLTPGYDFDGTGKYAYAF